MLDPDRCRRRLADGAPAQSAAAFMAGAGAGLTAPPSPGAGARVARDWPYLIRTRGPRRASQAADLLHSLPCKSRTLPDVDGCSAALSRPFLRCRVTLTRSAAAVETYSGRTGRLASAHDLQLPARRARAACSARAGGGRTSRAALPASGRAAERPYRCWRPSASSRDAKLCRRSYARGIRVQSSGATSTRPTRFADPHVLSRGLAPRAPASPRSSSVPSPRGGP